MRPTTTLLAMVRNPITGLLLVLVVLACSMRRTGSVRARPWAATGPVRPDRPGVTAWPCWARRRRVGCCVLCRSLAGRWPPARCSTDLYHPQRFYGRRCDECGSLPQTPRPGRRETELLAVTRWLLPGTGYDRLTVDAVAATPAPTRQRSTGWPSASGAGRVHRGHPPGRGPAQYRLTCATTCCTTRGLICQEVGQHASTIRAVCEVSRNPALNDVLQHQFV